MKQASKKIKNLTSLALLLAMLFGGIYLAGIGNPEAQANNTAQTLPFTQNWTNTGLITTSDDWANVPGIIGYRGDDLTGATGTDPQTILADGSAVVDVNANQTNPDTFATGGVSEFEIANPTIALQGSGTADAPHLVIFLNTTGQNNIVVTYNVRDIDGSADDAIQQVALQYRVGATGNYTNIPAGYIADATTGGAATLTTPVSATLPAAANNQSLVQIRIITTNAIGNDEWVGIDDINIAGSGGGTPTATPIPEFDLTISQADAPDPVTVGQPLTYTLTVSIIPYAMGGSASPVVRFNFPSGVPVSFSSANGTNGYTATPDANGVTFTGGVIATSGINAGTATLTVVITPQAAGTLTSAGGNVVVDPDNVIGESNENNNTAQTISTTVTPTSTVVRRLYDFNGNGTTDWTTLAVGSAGTPIRWKVTGNPASAAPNAAFKREFDYGLVGDTINAADYIGDGKAEVSVWRSGIYYVAQFPIGTGGITLDRVERWGQTSDIAGREGDYDGDGKVDYTVVRIVNNAFTFFIMSSSTNTMRAVQFGGSANGFTTFIFPGADFNGDGRDELIVADSNNSNGAVVYSIGDAVTGAAVATIQWGRSTTDFLVAPADYTGDGIADLVAIRQSISPAVWFIRNTTTGAATATQFGIADSTFVNNDLPVRGDYDGDGRHDIAVYRRSDNVFYTLSSSTGALIAQKAGDPGDIPLANLFVY